MPDSGWGLNHEGTKDTKGTKGKRFDRSSPKTNIAEADPTEPALSPDFFFVPFVSFAPLW